MAEILANHYVLAVHDAEKSAEWFVRTLGFDIVNRPDGWVFVKRDNCMVMLGECKGDREAHELENHSYFAYLRVDDADAFYAHAKESGADIMMPIASKPWKMREFGLRSPDGHRIMVGHVIG